MTDQRVAIVTGSSRGIGRAILEHLADSHACVVHYRRAEAAAGEVAAALRARGVPVLVHRAELESADDLATLVDTTVERFGRIDTFVANAAAGAFLDLVDSQRHHTERTLRTIVTSFVDLVGLITPHVPEGGRIVAIGGLDARFAQPGHGLLGASKAAIEALTRSLAVEFGPRGVTVNTVVPGPVATDSLERYLRGHEHLRRRLVEHTPIGRLVTPAEIAAMVGFLVGPAGAALTGQIITVDGGISAQGGPWRDLAAVTDH